MPWHRLWLQVYLPLWARMPAQAQGPSDGLGGALTPYDVPSYVTVVAIKSATAKQTVRRSAPPYGVAPRGRRGLPSSSDRVSGDPPAFGHISCRATSL